MTELLGFVFSPSGPIVVLVVAAIWLLRRPSSTTARRFVIAAAMAYALASLHVVPFGVSRLLTLGYHQFKASDVDPGTTAVVVLGGGDEFVDGWTDQITVTTNRGRARPRSPACLPADFARVDHQRRGLTGFTRWRSSVQHHDARRAGAAWCAGGTDPSRVRLSHHLRRCSTLQRCYEHLASGNWCSSRRIPTCVARSAHSGRSGGMRCRRLLPIPGCRPSGSGGLCRPPAASNRVARSSTSCSAFRTTGCAEGGAEHVWFPMS